MHTKQTTMHTNVITETAKQIADTLPAKPAKPLKGRDHARVFMPDLRNQVLREIWTAIPHSHKDEIGHRRTGGWFGFSKVISPEADAAFSEMMKQTAEELREAVYSAD